MQYVVYCDESRHDGADRNPFMGIGGLWVPREQKKALTRELRVLMASSGLNTEVKWSKVSRKYLDDYKRLVDLFFEREAFCFRCILVEQAKVDIEKYHGSDRELGFYKFYYEMLIKWLEEGNEYLILLDFKRNKGADRYTMLRRVLDRSLRGKAWVTDLTVIDSHQSPLAQLSDLLTGAVTASWCGIPEGSPKAELAAYIAEQANIQSLRTATAGPGVCKLNIFRIWL